MQNDMRDKLINLLLNRPMLADSEELANYLIANGVIVPPCKVGDTVYEFFDIIGFYNISELIVKNIVVDANSNCTLYCKVKDGKSTSIWHHISFGKTLFFTREQAEQKLKEMSDG